MTLNISKEEARKLVSKGALVVDVRSVEEFTDGHVPDSLNLPLHLIPVLAQEKIPKDRPVLLCCASGARSAMAAEYLKPQGYEVYNLGSWLAHPDLS
jgi:rhodanese-related sulfurtransferase